MFDVVDAQGNGGRIVLIRERLLKVVANELGLDPQEINDESQLEALCLQSLVGTSEEENKPSPQDGFRPTDFWLMSLLLVIAEEFGVSLDKDELYRVNTFADLLKLVTDCG